MDYEPLLNQLPIGVCVFDANYDVVYLNCVAQSITYFISDKPLETGKNLLDQVHPDYRDQIRNKQIDAYTFTPFYGYTALIFKNTQNGENQFKARMALDGILGYTELLKEELSEALDESHLQNLDQIYRSGKELQDLL